MRRLFLSILCVVLAGALFAQDSNDPVDLYNRAMDALLSASARVPVEGVEWLKRSAEGNYAPAQTALGYLYESGQFVANDYPKARDNYLKAAGQGDRLASFMVGRLYASTAFPPAPDQRDKWLRAAADAGDPFGAYLFARYHLSDDPALASKYLRQAAEQGLPFAQLYLGLAFVEGKGVSLDRREAYRWLLLSSQNGVIDANNNIGRLETGFSRKDIETLRAEVRELREKTLRTVIAHGCTGWSGEMDYDPAPPPLALQKYCR